MQSSNLQASSLTYNKWKNGSRALCYSGLGTNVVLPLRQVGKSDLRVSAIGLGCWQFSKAKNWVGKFWPALSQETIAEVIQSSLAAGITWFDTAEIYGDGESEKALSSALQNAGVAPGSVTIATKWWPTGRTANSITSTIGQRLACLAPYPIDVYQIHQPFSLSSIRAQMKAMAELTRDGKVRYVGVSNFNATRMEKAYKAFADYGCILVSNQMKYSLLDRSIERNGVMAVAKEQGISIIAYSPLEQGLLTGRFHEQTPTHKPVSWMRKVSGKYSQASIAKIAPLVAALRRVGEVHEATPAQIALAWLLQAHGETVLAIPGASSAKQAAANAGALHVTLTESELEELSRVSQGVQ